MFTLGLLALGIGVCFLSYCATALAWHLVGLTCPRGIRPRRSIVSSPDAADANFTPSVAEYSTAPRRLPPQPHVGPARLPRPLPVARSLRV